MAEKRTIAFSGDTVGLIVRGKLSADHEPDLMQQHADCILSSGAPIGYFGEGNEAKLNSIGLNMQGVVYDYDALRVHRPFYIQIDAAVTYRVVSTVLLVKVSKAEAAKFDAYWDELKRAPGTFHLLGANCSTHASESFVAAGIVKKGIPGLDTPDNLYRQLVKRRGETTSLTGFVGASRKPGGAGYDLVYQPFNYDPGVATPQQTKSERSLSSLGV